MEDAGELHTDDTCTDDGKAPGKCVELEQACGIDHAGIVSPGDGEPLRLGACGDDDMGSGVAVDRTGIDECSFLTNQCDVGVREDALDSLAELGHYLRHALTGLSKGS